MSRTIEVPEYEVHDEVRVDPARTALVVAIGVPIADPLIGLAITVVILRITWQSWQTVAGHHHQ